MGMGILEVGVFDRVEDRVETFLKGWVLRIGY